MELDGPPPPGGPSASGSAAQDSIAPVQDGIAPVQRVRLDLAYDGSAFRGFAENRGVDTVAGHLREALERVLRHSVALTCAGRTDAGVHARDQVVSFDTDAPLDPDRLRDSLNGMLGPEIAVSSVRAVGPDFDARFSATGRTYRYTVLNRPYPDPFLAATSWWVPEPLDRDALDAGCPALLGQHDFTSFCRRPKSDPGASLVRGVRSAGWTTAPEDPSVLTFEISAGAFCHQMVRSIVGTLVEVGRGKRSPGDVGAILAARDRSVAGQLAPPQGLVLWRVDY
jgi:tRNA pseudouridine38-40 synthase